MNLEYVYLPKFVQEEFAFSGAHCYSMGGRAFLLSDRGTSIVLGMDAVSAICARCVSEDLAFKLFQRGFAEVYGQSRYTEDTSRILPVLFMIDFTTKCNCNCIYCLRHFDGEGESISDRQLKKNTQYIIDYCHAHGVRHISFQPWGGEPLIELNKILACKQMFEDGGIDAKFNIQTNGLLLTLENYRKLRRHGIDIGVSIDGIARVHDAHRTDVHENPTHEKIVKRIKEIREADPEYNLGTLSVNSAFSREHVAEDIDYLVNELGVGSIKMNLVHPSGADGFDDSILISKEDIPAYVQDVLQAVVAQVKKGRRCYEANIADKLLNLLNRSAGNICDSAGCRGGTSFISIDRQGYIYPCEMLGRQEMRLGNVADGKDLAELIAQAKKENPYYKPRETQKCAECPFMFYCRGGCKACSLAYGKQACEIDETECAVNKTLYPLLIRLILTEPDSVEKLLDNRVALEGFDVTGQCV